MVWVRGKCPGEECPTFTISYIVTCDVMVFLRYVLWVRWRRQSSCRCIHGWRRTASFRCLPMRRIVTHLSRSPAMRSPTRSRSFHGSRRWWVTCDFLLPWLTYLSTFMWCRLRGFTCARPITLNSITYFPSGLSPRTRTIGVGTGGGGSSPLAFLKAAEGAWPLTFALVIALPTL